MSKMSNQPYTSCNKINNTWLGKHSIILSLIVLVCDKHVIFDKLASQSNFLWQYKPTYFLFSRTENRMLSNCNVFPSVGIIKFCWLKNERLSTKIWANAISYQILNMESWTTDDIKSVVQLKKSCCFKNPTTLSSTCWYISRITTSVK